VFAGIAIASSVIVASVTVLFFSCQSFSRLRLRPSVDNGSIAKSDSVTILLV